MATAANTRDNVNNTIPNEKVAGIKLVHSTNDKTTNAPTIAATITAIAKIVLPALASPFNNSAVICIILAKVININPSPTITLSILLTGNDVSTISVPVMVIMSAHIANSVAAICIEFPPAALAANPIDIMSVSNRPNIRMNTPILGIASVPISNLSILFNAETTENINAHKANIGPALMLLPPDNDPAPPIASPKAATNPIKYVRSNSLPTIFFSSKSISMMVLNAPTITPRDNDKAKTPAVTAANANIPLVIFSPRTVITAIVPININDMSSTIPIAAMNPSLLTL